MLIPTLHPALLMAAAVVSPALACASPQNHRPDADGYPCQSAARLAVVQDAQEFVIRKQPENPLPSQKPSNRLHIGENVDLDLAIFKRVAKGREADDASCC